MNNETIYLILSILILIGVIIGAFFLIKKEKPLPNKPIVNETFNIELKIHDSLPKSLVIQSDGTVIFKEGDKTNQIKVSVQEVEVLKQYILDNNFFSLKEKYEGSGCCDFVAHTITVTIGNKTHTVYCYNKCPEEFNSIKEKIKILWPYKIEYYGFS
jgi:hypothetical protein